MRRVDNNNLRFLKFDNTNNLSCYSILTEIWENKLSLI